MDWFTLACLGFIAFTLVNVIRLQIMPRYRMRALDLCHECALRIIDNHCSAKYIEAHILFHSYGSFDSMLWNWRAWTFDQFYPMLEARLAELEGSLALESK